jgi:hypothetical protein
MCVTSAAKDTHIEISGTEKFQRPVTATGVGLFGEIVPFPSWPLSFAPQHSRTPLLSNAQVWREPAAMRVAPLTSVLCGLLTPVA